MEIYNKINTSNDQSHQKTTICREREDENYLRVDCPPPQPLIYEWDRMREKRSACLNIARHGWQKDTRIDRDGNDAGDGDGERWSKYNTAFFAAFNIYFVMVFLSAFLSLSLSGDHGGITRDPEYTVIFRGKCTSVLRDQRKHAQSRISPSSSSSSAPLIYRTLLQRINTSPRLPIKTHT